MLTIEKTHDGTYRLEGVIDEAADFSALPSDRHEWDVAGIRRINSTGIQRWIRWKEQRAEPVVLSRVPPAVAIELSLIPELSRGTYVKSVQAPFRNPHTEELVLVLFEATDLEMIRTGGGIPTRSASDGTELEFDEDDNNYFRFLLIGAQLEP